MQSHSRLLRDHSREATFPNFVKYTEPARSQSRSDFFPILLPYFVKYTESQSRSDCYSILLNMQSHSREPTVTPPRHGVAASQIYLYIWYNLVVSDLWNQQLKYTNKKKISLSSRLTMSAVWQSLTVHYHVRTWICTFFEELPGWPSSAIQSSAIHVFIYSYLNLLSDISTTYDSDR